MSNNEFFEESYEKPGRAFWSKVYIEGGENYFPFSKLAKAIKDKKIMPGKALDIACGEGFQSIYLAKKGFDVMGFDFSEKAISYAKDNAKKAGVNIKFILMDVSEIIKFSEKFDFVLEYGFIHHYPKERWLLHMENVSRILSKHGKYAITCLNKRRLLGDSRKRGGKIYTSSFDEVSNLLKKYFTILDGQTFKIPSEDIKGICINYFLVERKFGIINRTMKKIIMLIKQLAIIPLKNKIKK
jgi:2-polyprenyl-3-methyl-5-hydroxy-6-metoxy-1,4-benzoquinol methylase